MRSTTCQRRTSLRGSLWIIAVGMLWNFHGFSSGYCRAENSITHGPAHLGLIGIRYPRRSGRRAVLRGFRLISCGFLLSRRGLASRVGFAVFRGDAPGGLQAPQEHIVQALSPRRSPAYTSKPESIARNAWITSDKFPSPRFRVCAANRCPQSGFAHKASLIASILAGSCRGRGKLRRTEAQRWTTNAML